MKLKVLFSLASLLYCLVPLSAFGPQRIVSLSPLGDELLEILVPTSRILSLSPNAFTENTTVSQDFAGAITKISPVTSQEIQALNPGLVLADWNTPLDILADLKKIKINLEVLREPGSWDDVRLITLKTSRVFKSDPMRILDVNHNKQIALVNESKSLGSTEPTPCYIPTNEPLSPLAKTFYQELLGYGGFKLLDYSGNPVLASSQMGKVIILGTPGEILDKKKILNLPPGFFTNRGSGAIEKVQDIYNSYLKIN